MVGGVYFNVLYKSIVSTLANRITGTHKSIVLAPPTVYTLDDIGTVFQVCYVMDSQVQKKKRMELDQTALIAVRSGFTQFVILPAYFG